MDVQYPPGMVQWGYKLDCAAEGCLEKLGYEHSDNGEIKMHNIQWYYLRPEPVINNHAAQLVSRVVPDWTPAVHPCVDAPHDFKERKVDPESPELGTYKWCKKCGWTDREFS